jgi:tetratricopeptide (TPR) repeat protein
MSATWLHISDFHFRSGDRYDSDVVLRSLVESVGKYRKRGRRVDLVFATGDIAHSGQPGEYVVATRFFDALLGVLELPRECLFVIPGNHDVDRKLGVGLARTLSTREECDDYFDPGCPKPHATQKMRAFREWFDGYFEGIRKFPTESSCAAVETLSVGGHCLAVLPINSALFCLDDHDHAKLLIGRRAIDAALRDLRAAKDAVTIALLHHPIDWLHEVERSNIKAALHRDIDVVLRGHLHETEVETAVTPVGQSLHIAAGAAYQTRKWPNRAYYATLGGERSLTIFPIRYEDSPTEIWTTDPSLFPDEQGHERSFSLSGKRSQSRPVSPSAPSLLNQGLVQAPARFHSNIASRGNAPFRGREALLTQISSHLSDTAVEQVLVLHGPPGVGKSELAREYARRHVDHYPGGRFILSGGSEVVELSGIGSNILGLQFAPELSLADQAEQTLLALHGRASLLIFDNPSSFEDVEAWLPRSGMSLHAIITTNNERWCDDWPSEAVGPLSDGTALELVQEVGGSEVARKLGGNLVALAGGLPVQLVPAARALAYEQRRGRLDKAAVILAQEAKDSFELACGAMPHEARVVLHAAAFLALQRILPDELFLHVKRPLGIERARFERLMDMCVDLHLLEGQGEMRMHQLLAAYLETRRAGDLEGDALIAIREDQASRVVQLARLVFKSPVGASNVGAFLSYPLSPGAWEGTKLGSNDVSQHVFGLALSTLGRFSEALPWFERSVDCTPRVSEDSGAGHDSLATSMHEVGRCLSNMGRHDEAMPWFERAVAETELDQRDHINHEKLGVSLQEVAECLSSLGRYEEARPWTQRAVEEKSLGDKQGRVDHESLSKSLHHMGFCLSRLGNDVEALPWFERAVTETEQGDVDGRVDHESLGSSIHQVGVCLAKQGHNEEALPWFERAISEAEQGDVHGRRDRESLGKSFHELGRTLVDLGRYGEAMPNFERAIAEKEFGDLHGRIDHDSIGSSHVMMGQSLLSSNQLEEAKRWFAHAVSEVRRGDKHGRVDEPKVKRFISYLVRTCERLGLPDEAQAWEASLRELDPGV